MGTLPGRCIAVATIAAATLAGCSLVTAPIAAIDGIRPAGIVDVRGGASVPYDGTEQWTAASAPSPASRTLTVLAFGSTEGGGGYCGPPVVRLLARETARAVHVLAVRYQIQETDRPVQCAPLDPRPTPHLLTLQRPLGTRTVVDASTGRVHHALRTTG